MQYRSTRGEVPALGFRDVLLAGLASDGGLYLPTTWPQVTPEEIAGFSGQPYAEVAADIVGRFAGGEIADADLRCMARDAYASFRHPAVAPLLEYKELYRIWTAHGRAWLDVEDAVLRFASRCCSRTRIAGSSVMVARALKPMPKVDA